MLLLPRRVNHFSVLLPALFLLASAPLLAQARTTARVDAVRFWSFGDVTRIAIETQGEYELKSDQIDNPSRVYFDLNGLKPPSSVRRGMQTIPVGDHRIKQIRIAEVVPGKTRIVFDLEGPVEVISSQLVNPDRLMVEIRPKGTSLPALSVARSMTGAQQITLTTPPSAADADIADTSDLGHARPSALKVLSSLESRQTEPSKVQLGRGPVPAPVIQPPPFQVPVQVPNGRPDIVETASSPALPLPRNSPLRTSVPAPGAAAISPAMGNSTGDRSLVRLFGLKLGRVVIDAGHGGKDTGTIGPNGLMEKDLVLDVALRLGKLIKQQLGADVVYTRTEDVFIPLEERTATANLQKADLFISIHANASPEPTATGVETYYFNLNADRKALDLAMRENASSGSSISDLNDLLHRAILLTKREESRDFALKVQESLSANSVKMNSQSRDRGVRQAPFVVLIGATMPSILAEIGFVSNPHDEKLMKRGDQREKIAEALFRGVTQYANSLSHTQIARAHTE